MENVGFLPFGLLLTVPFQGWLVNETHTRVVVKRWYNLFRYIVRTRTESSVWPYNPTIFARRVKSQFFYVQRIYKNGPVKRASRSFIKKSRSISRSRQDFPAIHSFNCSNLVQIDSSRLKYRLSIDRGVIRAIWKGLKDIFHFSL